MPYGNILEKIKKLPVEKQRGAAEDLMVVAQEEWQQYIGMRWRCPDKHGPLPMTGQQVAIACKHMIHQDEFHPVGMFYVPMALYKDRGFYICADCLKLLNRHKLDFWNQLQFTCWYCILEEAERIKQINPHLVVDLRQK